MIVRRSDRMAWRAHNAARMRRLALVLVLGFASTAYADDPPDTPWDPSVDECAAPDAGCQPERDLDDATLDRDEVAAAETVDPIEWDTTAAMACPDGSQPQQGACMADPSVGVGALITSAGSTRSGRSYWRSNTLRRALVT